MLSQKHIVSEPIRLYHEHLPSLVESLTQHGSLALMLLDGTIMPGDTVHMDYDKRSGELVCKTMEHKN